MYYIDLINTNQVPVYFKVEISVKNPLKLPLCFLTLSTSSEILSFSL